MVSVIEALERRAAAEGWLFMNHARDFLASEPAIDLDAILTSAWQQRSQETQSPPRLRWRLTSDPGLCSGCGERLEPGWAVADLEDEGEPIHRDCLPFLFLDRGWSTLNKQAHLDGGHLTVSSSRDSTRVSVFVARATPEAGDRRAPSSRKILVVDDDDLVIRYMSDIVSDVGFEVLAANRVDSAVRLFEQHADTIGLVITDQSLPDRTGADLVQILRAISPRVGLVICSGSPEVLEEDPLAASFDKFLTKPISRVQLLALVNHHMVAKR